jgi:LytS/YehU family sensor histidine kinase
MPLIENSFKHGVSETRLNPFIDIHLSVNRKKLNLTVKNSIEHATSATIVKENIGLSNLRRQLELLYSEYELTVKKENSVFTAELLINLASHV